MDPGLIWYPAHAVEKGVPNGSPKFYPNPTISSAQFTCGAHPTLSYIPQHKHNFIMLYWGKASQLNICLKAVISICQSEQVDEDLSQISVNSQLNSLKIDFAISLK